MRATRAAQTVRRAASNRRVVNAPRHVGLRAIGEWTSINVVMNQRHIAFLDLVRMRFRVQHQGAVSRGEIIRALVEFMVELGIDFSQFESVKEISKHLTEHFRALPAQGETLLGSKALRALDARVVDANRTQGRRAGGKRS